MNNLIGLAIFVLITHLTFGADPPEGIEIESENLFYLVVTSEVKDEILTSEFVNNRSETLTRFYSTSGYTPPPSFFKRLQIMPKVWRIAIADMTLDHYEPVLKLFPNGEVFELLDCNFSVTLVPELPKCRKFSCSAEFSPDGIRSLAKLGALEELDIRISNNVKPGDFDDLAKLPQVKQIFIFDSEFSNEFKELVRRKFRSTVIVTFYS